MTMIHSNRLIRLSMWTVVFLLTTSCNSFQFYLSTPKSKSVIRRKTITKRQREASHLPVQQLPSSDVNGDVTPPTDTKKSDTNDDSLKSIVTQLSLLKEMALPYYQESIEGRWLLLGLLGLTLLNSGVSVAFSFLGKDFWNALSEKDAAEFYMILQKYLAALLIGAPVVTFYRYQREQLAVHWREWMTTRTFDLYTKNRVYYNLIQKSEIDNPDQRITEDVNSFTSYSLQLVITMLTSVIDLVSFATILWGIYPNLFGAIILYALVGTFITTWLGKSLVGLNFAQLSKEANLRYSLVRVRENAESIAFYGGEDLEGRAVQNRLDAVMVNKRQINAAQRNLEFFTTSYRYLVQILPVAVIAPRYFAGEIQLGVISQSVGAFNHILSDLSIIVNQFESLSAFSAGIERLSSFYDAVRDAGGSAFGVDDALRKLKKPVQIKHENTEKDYLSVGLDGSNIDFSNQLTVRSSRIQMNYTDAHDDFDKDNRFESKRLPVVLSAHKLNVFTPSHKRKLVHNLDMEVREGEHLLIVGDSGVGKSSLLRAVAGLWTDGTGTIVRPVDEEIYFLPQRPYCTLGTLKDQILYPLLDPCESLDATFPRKHVVKEGISDEVLIGILSSVDLHNVATRAGDGDPVKGLYTTLDWGNILSLGEQQRLAFGRLLVSQPRLVILDEATSALDMTSEARMYNTLQRMTNPFTGDNHQPAPTLTYVSVGHRSSLASFHNRQLRLKSEKGHELSSIAKGLSIRS